MILKMRRQFIIVATCSVLAVLVVIISALNIINYHSVTKRKDNVLQLLSSNDGRFPEMMGQKRADKEDFPKELPPGGFDPERDFYAFREFGRMNFPREIQLI